MIVQATQAVMQNDSLDCLMPKMQRLETTPGSCEMLYGFDRLSPLLLHPS